ncbi:MAG: UDP-N-acetylmuramate dehydrogenase [Flavobacteriaceae bacterium]|nr:UDP-N-acetylmuramate dehydrogenase [Flavobacteriaceae bacterium]
MIIQENISLKPYNSFGIEAYANQFADIKSETELIEILKTHRNSNLFVLGGGSNLLLTHDINALVLHINNKGKEVLDERGDEIFVKIQAGENWHEFVLWCIHNDFGGIENLSLIPGNVGTAPIQNIGAYGVELKEVFESCEAIELESLSTKTFTKSDCKFGYRNSFFKTKGKGKYIITNVTFNLRKSNHNLNTSYGAIQHELNKSSINNPTIKDVSDAVIKIRQSKLPDPKKIGNSGSFFKNPVITASQFNQLKRNFPEIPNYEVSTTEIKIPAGWLIEKAGFKGKRFGNYGVHKNQALVLVNYGSANGNDIFNLSKLIQKTIKRIFNIDLEAEVNII